MKLIIIDEGDVNPEVLQALMKATIHTQLSVAITYTPDCDFNEIVRRMVSTGFEDLKQEEQPIVQEELPEIPPEITMSSNSMGFGEPSSTQKLDQNRYRSNYHGRKIL